jgi:hypothetical protein
MTEFPLRRAQLIAPGGPGSLQTSVDGVVGIVAGLDHWIDEVSRDFDKTEFEVHDEWRLSEALGVNMFVLPPDHREPFGFSYHADEVNMNISLPALRFPLWHWCRKCKNLEYQEIARHRNGSIPCSSCAAATAGETDAKRKKKFFMIQVQFIALCEDGHIQDFPFREWVHRTLTPNCNKRLKASLQGATLEGQRIMCECGAERNLSGILGGTYSADGLEFTTNLSKNLDTTRQFTCRGCSPWLDDFDGVGCGQQMVGGLTGAVNNYYPYVQSAIFLPSNVAGIESSLLDALQKDGPQVTLKVLLAIEPPLPPAQVASSLVAMRGDVLRGFTLNDVTNAIEALYFGSDQTQEAGPIPDEWRHKIKAPEYVALASGKSSMPSMLKLRPQNRLLYNSNGAIQLCAESLTLVDRLRETRALTGFGRVKPKPHLSLAHHKSLLRRSSAQGIEHNWLPAYEVYGEGIFFDFGSDRLKNWSKRPDVQERVKPLQQSVHFKREYPNCADLTFLPRLVVLHTLAHVLINQLVFDCGYTAASLRERLYCSDDGIAFPAMNGLLVYTASGDSEGSMGGLVRMGEPDELDRVFEAALDHARFCSSDPICMEIGAKGQGPNSMNLAACHSCALVPETSCELFNAYLDRALLIGVPGDPSLGLFSL